MPKKLASLTRQELVQLARKRNIPNVYTLRREKLLELLKKGSEVLKALPLKKRRAKAKPVPVGGARKRSEAARPYYEPTYYEEAVSPSPATGSPEFREAPIPSGFSAEQGTLPSSYNETRIVVLVRDPYWAHTYWDLNHEKLGEVSSLIRGQWGTIRTILRVYDVNDIPHFNGDNAVRYFDIDVMLEAKNWYIHLGVPNRDYVVDLGLLDAQGKFYLIARSNRVRTPRDGPSEVIDEEWMAIDFEEVYALSGGYGVGSSSGEVRERRKRFFEQQISSPGLFSGGISSPVGLKEKAKDFFLQVATELIVYGRTQADAQVTANGDKIPLRPDGSFSLRFFLPDGEKTLPIRAASKEGDQARQVVIRVKRETAGD